MENASKALLMAGGVMLTMLVVSLLMYGWNLFSEYQAELDRIKEVENVAKFNQQFTNYERNDVQGYELLSLVNKVIDYNQRHSEDGTSTGSAAGNDGSYESVDIKIKMGSDLSNLRGTIYVPTKPALSTTKRSISDSNFSIPKSLNNIETLFKENIEYSITTTKNDTNFETQVVNVIKSIEGNTQFGGTTGIQNLVKNMGTIFQGPIISYNGIPKDESDNTPTINYKDEAKSWYDMNYIISRYKTLTGVAIPGATDTAKINNIRDDDNIIKVLQYYEYSQFKKALFNCTNVKYDDNSSRVISMDFEFTGDIE